MPPTPLTIECRAVANRMHNAAHICGNTINMRKLVYEDSVTLAQLRAELERLSAPAEEIASCAFAIQQVSNVMECEGNVVLANRLDDSADWVVRACDALDG